MYVLYKRFEGDDYQVMEFQRRITASQIDECVGSFGWFASWQSSIQEAIKQAESAGFKFSRRPASSRKLK